MKETITAFFSNYRVYEYMLILNPHVDLRNKIIAVKKEFYEKYKASSALWAKPHISLISYKQYEVLEEKIINKLKLIAMGFKPVKIEMRDYGSFPAHTIYINVVSKVPIQSLVKQIRTEAQKLMKFDDDHKPHFMLEPYITIARKLQPWQYEKGWLEYSHRHFTGRFIADAMLLLKRPVGEMKYEIAARFEFENLDVGVAQGALF
jgi:2'-5' RNA ligase